jgi:hypothetical protein
MTLLSLGLTLLSAGWIAGRQVGSWLQNGEWEAYPLSSLIKEWESGDVTYTTASSDKPKTVIANWLLDVSAIVPILIASAFLIGFYLWLTSIGVVADREHDRNRRGGCLGCHRRGGAASGDHSYLPAYQFGSHNW